jgi:hypothetical protein
MPASVCVAPYSQVWIHAQWDCVRHHFGIDPPHIIGPDHLASAEELPDMPLVVMQPRTGVHVQGVESLSDFVHPDDAIYLFGPDEAKLPLAMLGSRVPEHRVYIPTVTDREMYSFVAFAIVMWDRRMTLG